MEYIRLGDGGLEVSRVGFGCWAIGRSGWGAVDDSESIEAIRCALQLGVTLFDTADVYGLGHSESILGRALGADRGKVIVSTKVGVRWTPEGRTFRDSTPVWIRQAIDDSLRRLNTDYIDLCHIHWPDPQTAIEDTLDAMDTARRAGKIRWVASSNFPRALFQRARLYLPLVSNQLPFNVLDRVQVEQFVDPPPPPCPVLAYGPLAQGLLTGKYDQTVMFPPTDVRSRTGYFDRGKLSDHLRSVQNLAAVAARARRRPAQVAIRWVLDTPGIACAIVGAKRVEQVHENAGIDFALDADGRAALSAISAAPVGEIGAT